MERGLIPPDSLSKLCGPTCGSYLMEAVRNALKIPSHYSSMDAEIESLTKVGFFLGNNVTHRGMGLFQLRAAVFGDLTEHGISATAEVQSLKVERLTSLNEFKTVSEIRIGELLPPLETAQVSIIAADPLHSNDQGHFYLVQKIETQDKLIWLIDPLRPYAPVIVPYQEVWNEKGTRELLLGNPPAVSVQGFLRVRLPSPK